MAAFKILSIDGGGIRGIIPAHWLTRLEHEVALKSGRSLLEAFDMFAGTSTGSIIAAGLANGRSANQIRELYVANGSKIFAKPLLRDPRRYWGAFRPAYSASGLDEVLEREFGNTQFGEAKKRLLIPAFKGGSRTLRLFDSGEERDRRYLLREIVQGSCSAPTYFPAKNMRMDELSQPLLDGGLAANNPAALALAVAFKEQRLPEDVVLVSLGTGVSQSPVTDAQGANHGKAQWVSSIVEVVFDGTSSANEILIEHVLPINSYFRLQKRDLRVDSALDRADAAHLRDLQAEADHYLDQDFTRFRQLIDALTAPDPRPLLPLDGLWESKYTWMEGGNPRESNWPETVFLQVSGHRVAGETKESEFPYLLRGRIHGTDFVGYTISRDKTVKLSSSFVLRMNVDSERELTGRWVGTGQNLYAGEWTLTRPCP
jgi:predicted acylesterase/phospholipase RssA